MNKDIYNTLRNRIMFLEYEPGLILKEQTLAEEFGVSRTPLRTVLFRLEWEYLVKILPRTGILISELELSSITNVFQARLELEAVIGTMARDKIQPEQLSRFDALQDLCNALKSAPEPKKLAELDIANKTIFHEAAGNPFLVETSERLYSLTFRLWYFNMLKMDTKGLSREVDAVMEDLVLLSELLRKGSPEETGRARKTQLLKHLKRIRSSFLAVSA
ncbi:MAG TPA: hypothetical protein DHV36_20340 [Desulfobacteraceae bacterium]|nr:hypothetical protein [Desulfobacteraceae bacterium]|tara:strand:- start:751 stop:1404 length:654 start_codon:yes stop_codon:yes gene_type:complete